MPSSLDKEIPDSCDVHQKSFLRRNAHSVRRLSVLVGSFLWLLGTGLWLTTRDQYPALAPIHYGLPLPILILCGTWSAVLLQSDRPWIRRGWLVVIGIQVICWLSTTVVFRATSVPDGSPALLFWNVCRGYRGYEAVGAEIAETHADVVALVEATGAGQDEALWRQACPGYEVTRLGSGMILLLRGQRLGWEFGAVPGECRYQILDLKVKEQPMTLIILDIKSDPRFSRKPAFDRLEKLITKYKDRPLIIAGDFNTPLESVYFVRMRKRMQNAFEARGAGWRDTWPVVLPVLSLDQVWGNEHVRWHRAEHGWSALSDHRPVSVRFTTREE